jgi:hypothetical protein
MEEAASGVVQPAREGRVVDVIYGDRGAVEVVAHRVAVDLSQGHSERVSVAHGINDRLHFVGACRRPCAAERLADRQECGVGVIVGKWCVSAAGMFCEVRTKNSGGRVVGVDLQKGATVAWPARASRELRTGVARMLDLAAQLVSDPDVAQGSRRLDIDGRRRTLTPGGRCGEQHQSHDQPDQRYGRLAQSQRRSEHCLAFAQRGVRYGFLAR